ncbi:hypothetical protein [Bartonella sp. B17]
MRAQFQEETVLALSEKNAVMRARDMDMAVIRDTGEQDGLAFGKVEKVSLFKQYAGVWGGVGVVSLLTTLLVGDLPNILVALLALLL